MGCRAPQTLQPGARFGHISRRSPWPWPSRVSGRRSRPSLSCPRPPSAEWTSVHWSGGRPVSKRPVSRRPVRSGCPDGHASSVRVRCIGTVRTALDPGVGRCGGVAHPWRIGFEVSRWSASGLVVAPRVVAARIGPGGEEMVVRWPCVARMGRRHTWPPLRLRTGSGAWPTLGAGSSARVPVGWLGSTRRSGCSQVPSRCVLGRWPA
jgi:hypothetical protein